MTTRPARTGTAPHPTRPGEGGRPGGAGRPGVADDVVVAHLPVVGHVVAELMTRVPAHVSRDDLTGAGVVALVQAARAYRADTGVPFGQYARIRVRGAVVDHLRSVDWVSRGARRQARTLADTDDRLRAELGRGATTEELAQAMGVTEAEVERARGDAHRGQVLSLEAESAHGEVLGELLAGSGDDPESQVSHAEQVGALLAAVAALPQRLRAVVAGYDLAEQPMADLARELGVTESRVSQMRSEALGLLRDALAGTGPAAPATVAQRRRDAYVAAARGQADLRARVTAGFRALEPQRAAAPSG